MHMLLSALNSHKRQDVQKYKQSAQKFIMLWRQSLGKFKTLTSSAHIVVAHGHLFIEYSQNELMIPNGFLSESSIECGNKLNRRFRFFLSRKSSLKHERYDMMYRHLWYSDPHVLAMKYLQVRKKGNIRSKARAGDRRLKCNRKTK